MTREQYLRDYVKGAFRQFVGGSWARRYDELRELLLRRDPSSYRDWDIIKKNMLVTSVERVLARQYDLCAPMPTNIFEFGPGLMNHNVWATRHYVYDAPEMIALQRYLVGSLATYTTDIATFLSLMKDNSHCPTAFIATWSLSECPVSIRDIVLAEAVMDCDTILLAYQKTFDFIDNVAYFGDLVAKHYEFDWKVHSASPLDGHYLVGRRNRWT